MLVKRNILTKNYKLTLKGYAVLVEPLVLCVDN